MHFDFDVVDYGGFPAVDVPHRPGLALARTQEALGIFVGSQKSVGLVVTEFNAAQDDNGNLAETLIGTIEEAIAKQA